MLRHYKKKKSQMQNYKYSIIFVLQSSLKQQTEIELPFQIWK